MRTYGGDIHAKSVFEKILSIGYEMETTDLTKLTLTSDGIFLNTDTARKDIAKINDPDLSEDDPEFDDYTLRQEELIAEESYVNGKIDKNVVFYITNDIASSPFVKELDKLCGNGDADETTPGEIKNEMYRFRPNADGEEDKPINFAFWNDETHCSVFSDVEWIFTHYKPAKSKSVILDTFFISIGNLIRHLDTLTSSLGTLIYTPEEEDAKEIKIRNPKQRVLFNKPGTNLYYLQTDNYKVPLAVDKICLAPQMTFSSQISDLFPILKQLASDSIRSIPSVHEKFEELLTLINMIEHFTQELLAGFNEKYPTYAITNTKNKVLYKSIKNYLALILYKLYIYINSYHPHRNNPKVGYLKDYLTFNSRHSNYVLYTGLKNCLLEYYSNEIPEKNIIILIRKLILQESILQEYLITDPKHVEENALRLDNKLLKDHEHYGDPVYSLYSYLHFFEDPLIDETNTSDDPTRNVPDWLVYKNIDIYSTPMELKDNIVLTEFRGFGTILTSYLYDNGNKKIKTLMTEGICNIRSKKMKPDIRGASIETLRAFINLKYPNLIANSNIKTKSHKSKSHKSKSHKSHIFETIKQMSDSIKIKSRSKTRKINANSDPTGKKSLKKSKTRRSAESKRRRSQTKSEI
jgi:hypothetical protein